LFVLLDSASVIARSAWPAYSARSAVFSTLASRSFLIRDVSTIVSCNTETVRRSRSWASSVSKAAVALGVLLVLPQQQRRLRDLKSPSLSCSAVSFASPALAASASRAFVTCSAL
jgi:hypothetical protein